MRKLNQNNLNLKAKTLAVICNQFDSVTVYCYTGKDINERHQMTTRC